MSLKISLFLLVSSFFSLKIAEGASGSIYPPKYAKIIALPDARRLAVAFEWIGGCKTNNSICRSEVKIAAKYDGGQEISTRSIFSAPNGTRKFHMCLTDLVSENSSSCAQLVPGLSESFSVSPLYRVHTLELSVKVCFNYTGNCASFNNPYTFVSPWRDPCRLSKPCGNYGTCKTPTHDQYNCSCNDWEGTNCTGLKETKGLKDKCFEAAINPFKNVSDSEPRTCLFQCKAYAKCKSFVFSPANSGSKKGSCKLYSGNAKDHIPVFCSGQTLFELLKDKDSTPSSSGWSIMASSALFFTVIAMAFLQ